MKPIIRARGRDLSGHTRGVPNRTEQRYAAEILEPLRLAGEIQFYRFESFSLRWGPGKTWTPDYYVLQSDGTIELIDVKGTRPRDEEAQRFKIRLAAQHWPEFWYVVARLQKGGGWNHEEIKP